MRFKPILMQICRSTLMQQEDYYRLINQSFDAEKYELVTVFLHGEMSEEYKKTFKGKIILMQHEKKIKIFRRTFFEALKLRFLLRGREIHGVLAHHIQGLKMAVFLRKFMAIGSIFGVIHGCDMFKSKKSKPFVRKYFAASDDRFVAVSGATRATFFEIFPEFPPDKCLVIYNSVNAVKILQEKLTRDEARKVLGLGRDDFVFGTAGRMVDWKAQDDLVYAFSSAFSGNDCWRLVIIGDGPCREPLLKLRSQLGREDKILLPGNVAKASRLFSAFDVFVLPSIDEPFGLVILEAMINGLPVIANTSGAPKEILPAGNILVEPKNREALSFALADIYSKRRNLKDVGEKNKDHAIKNFGMEKTQEKYKNLFEGR